MRPPNPHSLKLSATIARRQDARLREEAEALQISVSDLLRRIIDEHFDRMEQAK